MASKWETDLLSILASPKKNKSSTHFARIVSAEPIKIEIYGAIVERNIYMPSHLKKHDDAFNDNPLTTQWFEYLKIMAQQNELHVGDFVIVLRNADDFYILTKVI